MWYIHAMEYYLSIILMHATTWMNLKNIMQIEKKDLLKVFDESQFEKERYLIE